MEPVQKWICAEPENNFGSRCDKSPDGIYSTKRICENACTQNNGFMGIYEQLRRSSLNYPMDLSFLQQLASSIGQMKKKYEDFAKSNPGGQPPEFQLDGLAVEFNEYSMNRYQRLVSYYINFGHQEEVFQGMFHTYQDVAIFPKLYIFLAKPTTSELKTKIIEQYDRLISRVKQGVDNPYLKHLHNKKSQYERGGYVYEDNLESVSKLINFSMKLLMKTKYIMTTRESHQTYMRDLAFTSRFNIIPVTILFLGGSHANSLVIDTRLKKMYLIEPHVVADWSEIMDELIPKLFDKQIREYDLSYESLHSVFCPTGIQSGDIYDEGWCQTWNILLATIYILNPTRPREEVVSILLGMGTHVGTFVNLFAFYLFKQHKAKMLQHAEELNAEYAEIVSSHNNEIDNIVRIITLSGDDVLQEGLFVLANAKMPTNAFIFTDTISIDMKNQIITSSKDLRTLLTTTMMRILKREITSVDELYKILDVEFDQCRKYCDLVDPKLRKKILQNASKVTSCTLL